MIKSLTDEISYSKWAFFQVSLALFCVSIILNLSALEGFWRWDDPAFLTHISSYSPWQDLINPDVWQDISPSNFTPWLTFSYTIDLTLFGLNPLLFYLHQIVVISATAVILNALLALWLPPLYAIFSTLLFMIGSPVLLVAQQLMTRHYVEGLFFCLVSLFFFIAHLRHSSTALQIISAFFYFLATLAKEVFFPLFLILFFIPERNLSQCIRSTTPHVLIALLYIFWRAAMLGSLTGGYTANSDFLSQIDVAEILLSFSNFPNLFFGEYWVLIVAVYLCLTLIFVSCRPSSCLFLVIVIVSVLAPLIPLVRFPGINIADRYLLLPWLVFSISIGFFAHRSIVRFKLSKTLLFPHPVALASLAIACATALTSLETRRIVLATSKQFDVVGRFLWSEDDSAGYFPSTLISSSFWYVTELQKLRRFVEPTQTAPVVIVDPIFLETEYTDSLGVIVEYSEACQCMRPSDVGVSNLLAARRQNERTNAPLTLSFKYLKNIFTWSFGPYEDGAYHIVSNTMGVNEIPRAGSQRVTLDPGVGFILRYTSPEGWTTYSTLQVIDESAEEKFWRRSEL